MAKSEECYSCLGVGTIPAPSKDMPRVTCRECWGTGKAAAARHLPGPPPAHIPETMPEEFKDFMTPEDWAKIRAHAAPPAQTWSTQTVEHFKGGNYLILGLVRNASSENEGLKAEDPQSGRKYLVRCEWWVCYKSLDNPERVPFIRPMGEFLQLLYGGKARFADKDGKPAVPYCEEFENWLANHPDGLTCGIDR